MRGLSTDEPHASSPVESAFLRLRGVTRVYATGAGEVTVLTGVYLRRPAGSDAIFAAGVRRLRHE
jgi:hypothetical protein